MFEASKESVEAGATVQLSWSAEAEDEVCYLTTVLATGGDTSELVPCTGDEQVVVNEPVTFELAVLLSTSPDVFDTAQVTVTIATEDVAVTVLPGSVVLGPGQSAQFSAAVSGTDDTEVSWSTTGGTVEGSGSSVTYVAPSAPGEYEIIARSDADPDAEGRATITVEEDEPAVTRVTIQGGDRAMTVGETLQLTAVVETEGGAPEGVAWQSSAPAVAQVASGGRVTARGPGTTTITARSTYDISKVDSIRVYVEEGATAQEHTLSVTVDGEGTVTSTPSGIACEPTCSADFTEGTEVSLAVDAASDWVVEGWSGDPGCEDGGPIEMMGPRSCTVTLVQVVPEDALEAEITRLVTVRSVYPYPGSGESDAYGFAARKTTSTSRCGRDTFGAYGVAPSSGDHAWACLRWTVASSAWDDELETVVEVLGSAGQTLCSRRFPGDTRSVVLEIEECGADSTGTYFVRVGRDDGSRVAFGAERRAQLLPRMEARRPQEASYYLYANTFYFEWDVQGSLPSSASLELKMYDIDPPVGGNAPVRGDDWNVYYDMDVGSQDALISGVPMNDGDHYRWFMRSEYVVDSVSVAHSLSDKWRLCRSQGEDDISNCSWFSLRD